MRIFVSSAEPSGDTLAGALVRELRTLGAVELGGMGGPASRAAGLETWRDCSEVSVMGFSAVLAKLPQLLATLDGLTQQALRFRPDVAVLVDAPDFHLRLARRLKRQGVRVVQYVGPSVWAWRSGRVRAFRRAYDQILVLFPFELPAWKAGGVEARCVGHPLFDEIDEGRFDTCPQPGPGGACESWVLLPGSRAAELHHHLPHLWPVVERCPGRWVWPLAAGLDRSQALEKLRAAKLEARVELVDGSNPGIRRAAISGSRGVVAASGTVTLEVALLGRPQVIVYRTDRLTYAALSPLVRVPWLGLPNLLAGAQVVPELVQTAFTADKVEAALRRVACDDAQTRALAPILQRVRGPASAARRAAQATWALGSEGR